MKQWGNSRELTKKSYDLVKENPGVTRWTVRAAIHGALFGALGVLPGLVLFVLGGDLLEGDSDTLGIVLLALAVVLLVAGGLAGLTAANLQMAGLVHVADDVLHGREPDEEAARAAAHSHLRTLAVWSAISMAVSGLVSMIQGDGNSGFLVSIVRSLLAGLVATVWAVVTTLVMPVMVLEGAGAVAAIKRSASIVRGTWGEALLGGVRIGAHFGLMFVLPGVLLVAAGVAIAVGIGGATVIAGVVLAMVGIALMVVGAVRAATCRNVFGVALYRWATGEGALGPFNEDELRGAVQTKNQPVLTA